MAVVTTRIIVSLNGVVSVADALPVGEHVAIVALDDAAPHLPGKPFTMEELPIHDAPWEGGVSLHCADQLRSGVTRLLSLSGANIRRFDPVGPKSAAPSAYGAWVPRMR